MSDRVIRFPTERRLQAAAKQHAEVGQAVRAPEATDVAGEPFALLSIEIRRLPRTESRIDGEIAGRILNRCVLASLEVLSKDRIPVDLAGTVLRPVVEATFRGIDGTLRAARAAIAVKDMVSKVQRDVESEFHVFGAITAGATASLDGGVKVTTGSAEQLAARLREHAAPGQILLSESAWHACGDGVEVSDPIPVTIPGSDPAPTYVLSALPEPRS